MKNGKLGKNYSLAELESMETIESGHFDNLKFHDKVNNVRVWVSRMTVADGMPYNNQVTIEQYINGNWTTLAEYEAK